METIKKYWKAFVYAWFAYILLTAIVVFGRYYGFHANIVLGIFLFGWLTYQLRKKSNDTKERLIKTILIATPIIFFTVTYIIELQPFYTSPNFVFAQAIGVILGLIFERIDKWFYKLIIVLLPLIIGFWLIFQGADIWQHYIIYGTFRSGETLKETPVLNFKKDSVVLSNTDFKGRIVVFYFWNTTCPYSSRYFPTLRSKYERWKTNKNIEFYTVNFPVPSDSSDLQNEILKKWNIDIPTLIGPKAEESYKVFGSFTFPLTIILNPKGDIVFWGSIDRIDRTIEKLIKE